MKLDRKVEHIVGLKGAMAIAHVEWLKVEIVAFTFGGYGEANWTHMLISPLKEKLEAYFREEYQNERLSKVADAIVHDYDGPEAS